MFNPLDYLLTNISWYAPIYNIAWVLFMLYALTLPPLLLWIFKLPVLRDVQLSRPWREQRSSYGYLLGAAFVIFSFRLIPYWIFNDKILHFLGGGIAIALVYEYLAINFNVHDGNGIFTFRHLADRSGFQDGLTTENTETTESFSDFSSATAVAANFVRSVNSVVRLLANLTLLFFFASAFSVFSELYEFVSKYVMGYQFDSSGFDTWLDIMANMAGAFVGYVVLWGVKSQVARGK